MAEHDADTRGHQVPERDEVLRLQLLERRGGDGPGVRVAGRRSVAGKMLDDGQDSRVPHPARVRVGVAGDHGGIVGVGAVADDTVVGLAAHVHVGGEVHGDTELLQSATALERHLVRLLLRHRGCGLPGGGIGSEQVLDARHASTLLVDRHHQGSDDADATWGISRFASMASSVQLPTKMPPICSSRTT